MMPTAQLSSDNHSKHLPPSDERDCDATARARAPRVLIVEDEFLVAWHLQEMLRDLDLPVSEIAADPQGAIACAADFEPALVLMDINLGDGPDGIEVARRIRADREVAVVFVTAYSDPATVRRIRQVVPDAPVVVKPPSMRDLRAAIAQVLPAAGM
jgi:CheY-like chemotaxis protein